MRYIIMLQQPITIRAFDIKVVYISADMQERRSREAIRRGRYFPDAKSVPLDRVPMTEHQAI
jgi:hypothetical protein